MSAESRILVLLERLGALLARGLREAAARHGLKPVHLLILDYLGRANRYSDLPIAVAEYLGLTRGTVSQSLALLEARGLIASEPDARDGRLKHLRLTAAGHRLVADSLGRRLAAAFEEARGPEAAALAEGLERLLAALQRLNGQRAFGLCRGCRHFRREPGGGRCGLTGEPLSEEDSARLCREWSPPTAA
ncbi:MAG: MarR family transcriptional regulator [Xanthomonadales bacterium]|nr:MarR family transcriptional regulator [Xanthomonadales bacterium]